MRIFLTTCFLALSIASYSFAIHARDSVGVEEVKGKKFILHRIEMKETLYSVSRRYDVPINAIIKSNPPTEFGLEVGQIIKIPVEKKSKKKEAKSILEKVPAKENTASEIRHTVMPKETLFSISRKYNTSIDDIRGWNNLESNSIDIGQQIIIKKTSDSNRVDDPLSQIKTDTEGAVWHVVATSETLYSLSKKYDVNIVQLRDWNNLSGNEISLGQRLIVGQETVSESPRIKRDDTSEKADATTITADSIFVDAEPDKKVKERINKGMNSTVTKSSDFEEVVESGLATVIEGSEDTRKYLGLHRTAKVGTILRVKNEMNGQEVFVRVLGKLPDTGINKNVILKISKAAYDRLGAIDAKFRITISYIP